MAKHGTLIWGLEETKKIRMSQYPEMAMADPALLQRAIDEIERLRGIIRSCVHGTEFTDIGDGELIGLHRPNKDYPNRSKT